MERMDKGDLLHIGTAYVGVHTFKGKDYVTVRDFSTTTNALSKEVLDLEEENKKLKSDLEECECSMQYENDEVGYRKRECKKLKERIERWEKCFKKGGYNPQDVRYLMEEDTLQELKDIGELGDDELIYEEGLYD